MKKVTIYYLINGFGGYDTLDEAISVAKNKSEENFYIGESFYISKITEIEEIVYLSESEDTK